MFQNFQPHIPPHYQDSEFLFLANIQPELQATVRREMKTVRLTGGDTMNYWINTARKQLAETLKLVDVLLINDTEAKSLAGETNLPRAALKVLAMGPQALVIKHGEYGATIFFRETHSASAAILFVRPRCPSKRSKTPPGPEIRLPAASWDTSPRRVN